MTIASRGRRSRAIDSGSPIVTLSRTRALAPFTFTGSVVACESCRTILSGPSTSTLLGEAATGPMTKPGAGVPSTLGTTGTRLLTDVSNWSDTVEGSTCNTVTPCGTVTSPGVRRNSRLPARADRRSRSAMRLPLAAGPRCPAAPRTRTSTALGGSPVISSDSGMFWNSSATRSNRSACCCPATRNHRTTAKRD